MADAQSKGTTTDAMLGAIYLSEYINQRSGGVLVKPWEVNDLPAEYLDFYRALQKASPRAKPKSQFESLFAEHRKSHPSYRKY